MKRSGVIQKLGLLAITCIVLSCISPHGSHAQEKKSMRNKDSVIAAIDYLYSEDGKLHFKAHYSSTKKEKTTLYVRDKEGELVYQDRLTGMQAQKIYIIPSDCSSELVFEWVKPQRILLKKFIVSRAETTEITVQKLN